MPPVAETYHQLTDLLQQPLRNLSHGLNLPNLLQKRRVAGSSRLAPQPSLAGYEQQLVIKVVTDSDEQKISGAYQDRGMQLARQDRWHDLAHLIGECDINRKTTPSGLTYADLLAFGARSDMVLSAEHALLHGELDPESGLDDRIAEFEDSLADHPNNYALALILAHTHIDIGWAWRGSLRLDAQTEDNRREFYRHFRRASEVLEPHCGHPLRSPAVMNARCALLPGQSRTGIRVADDFETLIDLDPENPRSMRALGNYLLPRWYGSVEALELEARRTAARTMGTWGAGGYAWVYFDALLTDQNTLNMIDMPFFLDGIRDILDLRGDQQTVNLMAAHTHAAAQMARSAGAEGLVDPALADQFRAAFDEIIDSRLRQIHPLIWGHAEIGFDNASRAISLGRLMEKGRQAAMLAIAGRYRDALRRGDMVVFRNDKVEFMAN